MVFGKHVNKYYKKYFWFFAIGIFALIFIDYVQLFVPEIIGNIVDAIISGEIAIGKFSFLYQQIFYIFIIGVIMFLGRCIWRFALFGESVRIQADIRKDMFMKCTTLSQRYFKANKTGAILSYFSNDLETVEEAFGFGIVQFLDGVFLLVLSLVKMFLLDKMLTLILLLPLAILATIGVLIDKLLEKKWEMRQKTFEDLSDFTQENITGIRVVKAFVKEKKELRRFAKNAYINKEANISFVRVSHLLDVLFDALIYIIHGIILVGGAYLVYLNKTTLGVSGITVGELVKFVGYFETLIWPIIALAGTINLIARTKTSMKRISSLLDERIEIVDNTVLIPEELTGEIEFRDFSFAYPDDENTKVLKNITLKIKNGESVGIVGKIGSGKSTLVNMLFRLYNVSENTLFLGGFDIMHLPIKLVRSFLGYSPQDNFLYSDTIKANIAFSNVESTKEEIENASSFASVKENIENFPDKYDTLIGEKGVSLSGGQKQRISIARAILKDPKILVLDDSVSAVDVKTEEEIIENIKKYRKNKTTILVSSRVSTVNSLDKIIVLNDGELEYFGTPHECLENSKTYQRMVYLQQLKNEMEEKK